MKKYITGIAFLSAVLLNAQNKFLDAKYWKEKPTLETIKADITAGSNASELNVYRYDAVVQAINNNAPLEVIQYLIAQPGNQNVNKLTGHDRSYLHYAAMKNRADVIEFLLKNGADMFQEDTLSTNAAEYGAWLGQLKKDGFEKFFQAGYPVKRKNNDGVNLLMWSAFKEDETLETTKYLISKGISPADKDKDGRLFTDYAARGGKVAVIEALHKENFPFTNQALILAASGFRNVNGLPALKYLVETVGISPQVLSPEGKNVLHLLSPWNGSEEQVAYFIGKGVRVSQQDNDGNTPFLLASRNRKKDNIQLMLEKSAAKNIVNTANKKGQTPLMLASKFGSVDTMKFLIDNGAALSSKDADGNSLLFYLMDGYKARGKNEIEIIRQKIDLLKQHGFDFSTKNADGNTALHIAASHDSAELLDLAFSVNKEINAVNDYGFSPLMSNAIVATNTENLKKLLSWGANKSIKNDMEETAFSLANDNQSLKKSGADLSFLK